MVRLFVRAFSALLFFFTAPVVAETPYEFDLRLSQMKTWEEACVEFDCSQFPQGYSTWLLGDEYYYFRLEAIQPPPEPGQIDFRDHDPMLGPFVERDADGRVLRSFHPTSKDNHIRFIRCCKWLLDQVGLLDAWPGFKQDRFPLDYDYEKPELHRMRWDAASVDLIAAKSNPGSDFRAQLFPENPDGTRQDTLDNADRSGWISLNDDFWLVEFGNEVKSANDPINSYRMVKIVSKEPMFFDRYIFGHCDFLQTCDFHTPMFTNDGNLLPGISINAMNADEYKARDCADPNPVLTCDTGLEFFDKLKPAFQTLEVMFERLQTRPEDIDRPKE